MRPPVWRGAASRLWHAPGRVWNAALAAANITLWWRFGACIVVSVLVAWIIWIFAIGPWSDTEAIEMGRLTWLGVFGTLLILGLLACVSFLFERRVTLDASRTGISLRAGESDAPAAKVVTETTVTAANAAARPADDEGVLPPEQRVSR